MTKQGSIASKKACGRAFPVYERVGSARTLLAEALGITTAEAERGLIALVKGGYGIAPRNPTNGMLVAYLEALTPPVGHESVVTAIGKARVRWQAMLRQGTERALSRKVFGPTGRLIASGMEAATAGETVQQGSTEGDSPTAAGGDAQTTHPSVKKG